MCVLLHSNVKILSQGTGTVDAMKLALFACEYNLTNQGQRDPPSLTNQVLGISIGGNKGGFNIK